MFKLRSFNIILLFWSLYHCICPSQIVLFYNQHCNMIFQALIIMQVVSKNSYARNLFPQCSSFWLSSIVNLGVVNLPLHTVRTQRIKTVTSNCIQCVYYIDEQETRNFPLLYFGIILHKGRTQNLHTERWCLALKAWDRQKQKRY